MTYRWKVKYQYLNSSEQNIMTGFVRAKSRDEAFKKAEIKFDPFGIGIFIISVI